MLPTLSAWGLWWDILLCHLSKILAPTIEHWIPPLDPLSLCLGVGIGLCWSQLFIFFLTQDRSILVKSSPFPSLMFRALKALM